ncbi:restriction endonuclease subunit S [Clostridium sp. AN503]|uniref:restriction endonuclease subunit S n=1 Tax=Clostridium sp. AN503 TaxID=3160598 RepID=UPI003458A767
MQSEKYSRENAGQSLKKYILLKQGELAYNHGASKAKQFGCCYELTEPEARIPYVYHCFKVMDAEYTPYIAMALNNAKMDKQLKRLVSSSVRMDGLLNISFEDYMSVTLHLPSSDEQKRIADFLKKIDKRIAVQERLLASLKKYKRGFVSAILSHQIMFSDVDGKSYPKWITCTLQDAVDFLDGQRKPLESADRAKRQGRYPYYGASGIIDYIDDYIFDEPLLLLGEDGANILNRSTPLCFIAAGKYWVNNHAHVMRPKAGQNIKFLCELLESLDYTRYNTGTAQPKLNQEKCREIELILPIYEEQCRIAAFLSAFDQRADRAQNNLEYLLSIRAGLQQQLFI